jgi:hypothetical protein
LGSGRRDLAGVCRVGRSAGCPDAVRGALRVHRRRRGDAGRRRHRRRHWHSVGNRAARVAHPRGGGGPGGGPGPPGPVGRGGPPCGTIWLKLDAWTPVGPTTCAPGRFTSGAPIGPPPIGPPAPPGPPMGGGAAPVIVGLTRICAICAVGGGIIALSRRRRAGHRVRCAHDGRPHRAGRSARWGRRTSRRSTHDADWRDAASRSRAVLLPRRVVRGGRLGVASSSGERRPSSWARRSRARLEPSGVGPRREGGTRLAPGARHLFCSRRDDGEDGGEPRGLTIGERAGACGRRDRARGSRGVGRESRGRVGRRLDAPRSPASVRHVSRRAEIGSGPAGLI